MGENTKHASNKELASITQTILKTQEENKEPNKEMEKRFEYTHHQRKYRKVIHKKMLSIISH